LFLVGLVWTRMGDDAAFVVGFFTFVAFHAGAAYERTGRSP
jgi:hypothetical protein